jgi:hypothetical protein
LQRNFYPNAALIKSAKFLGIVFRHQTTEDMKLREKSFGMLFLLAFWQVGLRARSGETSVSKARLHSQRGFGLLDGSGTYLSHFY